MKIEHKYFDGSLQQIIYVSVIYIKHKQDAELVERGQENDENNIVMVDWNVIISEDKEMGFVLKVLQEKEI